MYKKFYGLTRNPFEISPDPYFFYPTPRHNEALASLTYGIHARKGFVVVTGEVGTGKTLLIRFLLEALNRNHIAFAFVYNPKLSVLDFLAHVLTDLRIPFSERTKSEMLSRLNNFLLTRSRRGGTAALVVDEAQLLDWDLLEEIRLLTNLETSEHKLLQIVLVGQPELDQKLDAPQLRQLKQRIVLRCKLEPLGFEELRGYIYRRLELAGANSHAATMFPDETILTIHKFTKGIPRLANTLCENSLISGFSREAQQITTEIVEEVAASYRLEDVMTPESPSLEDPDRKKRLLKKLLQLIDEMDAVSGKTIDETSWASGMEAE
jgi:general secretion pathway protein A